MCTAAHAHLTPERTPRSCPVSATALDDTLRGDETLEPTWDGRLFGAGRSTLQSNSETSRNRPLKAVAAIPARERVIFCAEVFLARRASSPDVPAAGGSGARRQAAHPPASQHRACRRGGRRACPVTPRTPEAPSQRRPGSVSSDWLSQPLSRDLSNCLPCSAPLRLSACALRKSSASSLSPSRLASWTYVSSRSALLRHCSVNQMRL